MKRVLFLMILGITVMAGPARDGYPVGRCWAAATTTGMAWDLYNAGQLEKAEKAFTRLTRSKDPILTREALLGLGYTRLKQGRLAGARECFSTLVHEQYKTAETLPVLLDLLIRLNEFEAMDHYLPMLDARERQAWTAKRSEARGLNVSHDDILNQGLTPPLETVESYKRLLHTRLANLPEASEERPALAQKILSLDPTDLFANTIMAWHALNSGEYPAAEQRFSNLAAQKPDDMDLVLGLGYSLYHQDKLGQAVSLLESSAVRDTPKIRELKGFLFQRRINLALATGGWDRAWALTQTMNASGDNALIQIAAQWLADHNSPIIASQMLNSPEACYFNADKARLESALYHRHKNGDTGTSQLDETGLSAGFINPYGQGRQWSLTLSDNYLSSGDNGKTTGGSYYRYLNGQKPLASPDGTLNVQRVALGWAAEGPFRIQACLGTSPVNGPVGVTPTFFVSGEYNTWRFHVHRSSINDSILSYAGLEDPYGETAWGQVVKNGVTVGKTFNLGEKWWFSADAGADAYRGNNVWKNNAWHLNAAVGKTIMTRDSHEITGGLYAGGMGFDHNTNFYTFGHGGYYSPELMVVAGPFVRFRTAQCRNFWIDTQISLGWMMEETEDSPYYPIHYESIKDFTPEALEELHGIYPGERENRLAYTVRLEAWKRLSNHLSIGGLTWVEQSSNSLEWRIGMGIDYYFGRQNRFWKRDSLASRFPPCSR